MAVPSLPAENLTFQANGWLAGWGGIGAAVKGAEGYEAKGTTKFFCLVAEDPGRKKQFRRVCEKRNKKV